MGTVDSVFCEVWGPLSNRRTAQYVRQYGEISAGHRAKRALNLPANFDVTPNYYCLCGALQGDPPVETSTLPLGVGQRLNGAPLNVDTLQIRQSQLFAALKIAMRRCFDNVINALNSNDVCCDAVLYGDIANNYVLWRL